MGKMEASNMDTYWPRPWLYRRYPHSFWYSNSFKYRSHFPINCCNYLFGYLSFYCCFIKEARASSSTDKKDNISGVFEWIDPYCPHSGSGDPLSARATWREYSETNSGFWQLCAFTEDSHVQCQHRLGSIQQWAYTTHHVGRRPLAGCLFRVRYLNTRRNGFRRPFDRMGSRASRHYLLCLLLCLRHA